MFISKYTYYRAVVALWLKASDHSDVWWEILIYSNPQ